MSQPPAPSPLGVPRFNLIGPDQLLTPVPPPRYLVPGLVPEHGVTIFYGHAGSYKTWLVMALSLSLAAHKSFAGYPAEARKVVLLDFEMGPHALRYRLQQLAQALAPFDRLEIQAESLPSLYLTSPGFFDALRAVDLGTVLLIDSFAAACPGVNENDASVRVAVDAIRRVLVERELTVILVHHAGKDGSLRGNSSLEQAVDEIVRVTKTKDGNVVATATKGRLAPVGPPLGFRLVEHGDGLRFERVDIHSPEVKLGDEPGAIDEVLEFIRANPGCSKRDVRKGVGENNDAIDEAIDQLLTQQRVVNRGSNAKHCYHAVEANQTPPGPRAPCPDGHGHGPVETGGAVPGVPVPPIGGARWGTPPGMRTEAQPPAAPEPGGVSAQTSEAGE